MAEPFQVVIRTLDEHFRYVHDAVRLSAYQSALREVVQAGSHVLDLGCGTGVLGVLACRAGAARVTAIDRGGILEVARQAAKLEGLADRVSHLRGQSTEIHLPNRADVLVCDQLGPLGFDAGLIASCADARARLLQPEARYIPAAFSTWFAPIEAPRCHHKIARWNQPLAGLHFVGGLDAAASAIQQLIEVPVVLAPFQDAWRVVTDSDVAPMLKGQLTWRIERPGDLHGLAGGFVAELAPGISISNLLGRADRIDRQMAFLPLWPAIAVQNGDTVELDVMTRPDVVTAWRVRVTRGNALVAEQSRSTLQARLWASEDLAPR